VLGRTGQGRSEFKLVTLVKTVFGEKNTNIEMNYTAILTKLYVTFILTMLQLQYNDVKMYHTDVQGLDIYPRLAVSVPWYVIPVH
jgi:hypothetical protein